MTNQTQHLYEALSFCKNHPVMGRYVQWMDLSFALELSNPDFKQETDLGNWQSSRINERVGLDALVQDILKRGMRDPFIIGIGSSTSYIRLETGNQRVRALASAGVERIPVVGLYSDTQITNTGNGVHHGLEIELIKPRYHELLGPYQERRYCRLSDEVLESGFKLHDHWTDES